MRRLLPILISGLAPLALGGCGEDTEVHTITDVRTREKPRFDVPQGITPAQRYGYTRRGERPDGHQKQPAMGFSWTTPEGWSEKPLAPGGMRKGSWTIESAPEADCSLVVLGGTGGGLLGNVNRWREQMGLPEIDQAAADALPRRTLLERESVYVDLKGAYGGGMGGGGAIAEARMLGLIIALPQSMLFLKFTGPADVVGANQAAFEALADSITFGAKPSEGGSAGPAPEDDTSAPPERTASEFVWVAPEGWEVQPARMMRIVTLVPTDIPTAWCYASRLGGTAGGLAMNINRWRGEMGHRDALDAAGIAKLKTIDMLGGKGTLIDVEGDFSGTGGIPQSGARMLGVVCPRENDVVFVKMVGPVATVAKHYDAFVAFCRSLEEAR